MQTKVNFYYFKYHHSVLIKNIGTKIKTLLSCLDFDNFLLDNQVVRVQKYFLKSHTGQGQIQFFVCGNILRIVRGRILDQSLLISSL